MSDNLPWKTNNADDASNGTRSSQETLCNAETGNSSKLGPI